MKKYIYLFLLFVLSATTTLFAQTKVSGIIVDKDNLPIPYANVAFKGSSEGIVSNEDGKFYLESPKTYTVLMASSVGFNDREID